MSYMEDLLRRHLSGRKIGEKQISELVKSGHLQRDRPGVTSLTEKGRRLLHAQNND